MFTPSNWTTFVYATVAFTPVPSPLMPRPNPAPVVPLEQVKVVGAPGQKLKAPFPSEIVTPVMVLPLLFCRLHCEAMVSPVGAVSVTPLLVQLPPTNVQVAVPPPANVAVMVVEIAIPVGPEMGRPLLPLTLSITVDAMKTLPALVKGLPSGLPPVILLATDNAEPERNKTAM